jgi:hypothetical protein
MIPNMDLEKNDHEVTIRGMASVEGGTTCAPCVDKRHAECDISDCLCAKNNHVVN